MIVWSIWGLLGALPGATLIRGSIAAALLYQTGILDIIAMLFGITLPELPPIPVPPISCPTWICG